MHTSLPETDDILIDRSKNGDREAFRQLVETHQQFAFALAFRIIRDEEEARDITQETFLRVWTHIRSFQQGKRFPTWLYTITTNVSLDRLKRRRTEYRLLSSSPENDPPGSDLPADEQLANRNLADIIAEAGNRLPEKQRLVFILRDLQDLSVEETAKALSISPNAVRANLCYARKEIRKRVGGMIRREEQHP